MIEPLLDRVVVEVVKKDERTESGIILPDTVQDTGAPQQAVVREIGEFSLRGDILDIFSNTNFLSHPI